MTEYFLLTFSEPGTTQSIFSTLSYMILMMPQWNGCYSSHILQMRQWDSETLNKFASCTASMCHLNARRFHLLLFPPHHTPPKWTDRQMDRSLDNSMTWYFCTRWSRGKLQMAWDGRESWENKFLCEIEHVN